MVLVHKQKPGLKAVRRGEGVSRDSLAWMSPGVNPECLTPHHHHNDSDEGRGVNDPLRALNRSVT